MLRYEIGVLSGEHPPIYPTPNGHTWFYLYESVPIRGPDDPYAIPLDRNLTNQGLIDGLFDLCNAYRKATGKQPVCCLWVRRAPSETSSLLSEDGLAVFSYDPVAYHRLQSFAWEPDEKDWPRSTEEAVNRWGLLKDNP